MRPEKLQRRERRRPKNAADAGTKWLMTQTRSNETTVDLQKNTHTFTDTRPILLADSLTTQTRQDNKRRHHGEGVGFWQPVSSSSCFLHSFCSFVALRHSQTQHDRSTVRPPLCSCLNFSQSPCKRTYTQKMCLTPPTYKLFSSLKQFWQQTRERHVTSRSEHLGLPLAI